MVENRKRPLRVRQNKKGRAFVKIDNRKIFIDRRLLKDKNALFKILRVIENQRVKRKQTKTKRAPQEPSIQTEPTPEEFRQQTLDAMSGEQRFLERIRNEQMFQESRDPNLLMLNNRILGIQQVLPADIKQLDKTIEDIQKKINRIQPAQNRSDFQDRLDEIKDRVERSKRTQMNQADFNRFDGFLTNLSNSVQRELEKNQNAIASQFFRQIEGLIRQQTAIIEELPKEQERIAQSNLKQLEKIEDGIEKQVVSGDITNDVLKESQKQLEKIKKRIDKQTEQLRKINVLGPERAIQADPESKKDDGKEEQEPEPVVEEVKEYFFAPNDGRVINADSMGELGRKTKNLKIEGEVLYIDNINPLRKRTGKISTKIRMNPNNLQKLDKWLGEEQGQSKSFDVYIPLKGPSAGAGITQEWKKVGMIGITTRKQRGRGSADGIDLDEGLTTTEINAYMDKYSPYGWKGTYPIDHISEIPVNGNEKQIAFIFNTDDSTSSGQHWVAVYIDLVRGTIEYYDSYADEPEPEFLKEIKELVDKIDPDRYLLFKVNKVREQNSNSSNCGYFCIKFLIDRFAGKTFKECTGWNNVEKSEKEIEKFKRKFGSIKKFSELF